MSSKTVYVEYIDDLIYVSGNTYPIKEDLKSEGATWFPDGKSWKFQGKDLKEIQELVENVSPDEIIVRPYDAARSREPKKTEPRKTTKTKSYKEYQPDDSHACPYDQSRTEHRRESEKKKVETKRPAKKEGGRTEFQLIAGPAPSKRY